MTIEEWLNVLQALGLIVAVFFLCLGAHYQRQADRNLREIEQMHEQHKNALGKTHPRR